MKRVTLGGSDVEVSEICLGTMTFGNQTPEPEGHAQMDRALDAGITFMDTAEMYPVNPVRRETIGLTETILGNWLARSGNRDRVEIATKITGPSQMVRDNAPYDGAIVAKAIDASLKRLQTDRIDLYQMHWPVRGSYAFRQNWTYDPSKQSKQRTLDHMADVLGALSDARKAGKIRAFGLSNESAWGTLRWIDTAERLGGPRVVSVQNEYSLLHRLYDTDMAEVAANEKVTLLAYSPLAAATLTGKYLDGRIPPGTRRALDHRKSRYDKVNADAAVRAYLEVSKRHGLDPAQMALAFVTRQPFVTSNIIGATSMEHLKTNIDSIGITLGEEVLKEIEEVNDRFPNPCP